MARLDAERKQKELTESQVSTGFIPCLYLPYLGGSSKLLIYFHGNAEDVGLAMELLAFIKEMLKVSLLGDSSYNISFHRCTSWRWNTLVMESTKVILTRTKSP